MFFNNTDVNETEMSCVGPKNGLIKVSCSDQDTTGEENSVRTAEFRRLQLAASEASVMRGKLNKANNV